MSDPARAPATYEDVRAAPDDRVAELIAGELNVSPRPSVRHARATTRLASRLGPPFDEGRGGPGGWVLLVEPEVHLANDVVVPDLAGWRRENLPTLPDEAFFTVRPDWLCEVASPSTEQLDRSRKLPLYAANGVPYVWIVQPTSETLEVLRLEGTSYLVVDVFAADSVVRAEPFGEIELELAALWAR
ncbi:MAG: Uma2 family endonuclease [Myxococcota bacterium]